MIIDRGRKGDPLRGRANSTLEQLTAMFDDGEEVVAVIFRKPSYAGWIANLDGSPPVPPDRLGEVLTWEEAQRYMTGWVIEDEDCYLMRVWTTTHVYFTAGYDGRWWIECVPLHPSDAPFSLVGGG